MNGERRLFIVTVMNYSELLWMMTDDKWLVENMLINGECRPFYSKEIFMIIRWFCGCSVAEYLFRKFFVMWKAQRSGTSDEDCLFFLPCQITFASLELECNRSNRTPSKPVGRGIRWPSHPALCLSVFLFVCLSVFLSVCLSASLSVCLSGYLPDPFSLCLSVPFPSAFYLSLLSDALSFYPSLTLFVCLFVCLSLCLSVFCLSWLSVSSS